MKMETTIRVRIILILSLLLLLLAYKLRAPQNHSSESVIIITKLGRVKGSLMQTNQGKTLYAFRGLRYAEPPTGQLRFKPAVPVKAWNHVFDATEEGPSCPQKRCRHTSEDCLTMNIYTKQLPRDDTKVDKKLPVIMFIHAGGLYKSSGQSYLYGPLYLLDQDIVLVTINHRLGALSFMTTGDHRAPGNLGLKDQVEALRFIRDNIASFGGDPNSVTLTGHSSGSRSVVLHMVSPMSKGLFHRAIAMSGTMITPIRLQRENIDMMKKQARLLNCTTESIDEMFSCFMEKPASEYGETSLLFREFSELPITLWYPTVEPEIPGVESFLLEEPEELMRQGKIHDVPLIIGETSDEFMYLARPNDAEDEYFGVFRERWYELAPICCQYERNTNRSKFISDELYNYYFGEEPITPKISDALGRLFIHALVHFPVHRTTSLMTKFSSVPIYFYVFSYVGRYSKHVWHATKKPLGGVGHGDDVVYLFNIEADLYHEPATFPHFNENDPEFLTVKKLTTLWAHFAKTGEPLPKNTELFGNVTWEPLTPETKRYLDMGKDFILKTGYVADKMEFWDNLFP